MKKAFFGALFLSIFALLTDEAGAFEKWDVEKEIARLAGSATNFAAYPAATEAISWKLSDRYYMSDDGDALHDSIYILSLREGAGHKAMKPIRFPYPEEESASFDVTLAAWYDPDDGSFIDELAREEYDLGGIRGVEISFPEESAGCVAAITVSESIPSNYRLDGVVSLAVQFPVWERTVELELPGGMPVYWEGVGVREPERVRRGKTERYTWTVLNEPAWGQDGTGLLDAGKPILAFSLNRGQLGILKKLRELENPAYAPKVPSSVVSVKSDLKRTLQNIAGYMSARSILPEEGADRVRKRDVIGPDGPWTGWEQVLIAARWVSSLGFETDVYWIQKIPSGTGGPAAMKIWREPVLRARGKNGADFYFKSGQIGNPEKLHSSLYGEVLYKAGNNGAERITLPRGAAADHVLSQNWKVSVNERGIASGRVDITFTGAWMDVFSQTTETPEIMSGMNFSVPGITFEESSSKNIPTGRRVSYTVQAAPGIVSQDSLLLKLMGGLPVCFGEIPRDGSKYSLRFPFIFEVNAEITTPKGYKALSLPGKASWGDSNAGVEQSAVHWPRKRLVESSCRWTVRSFKFDEYQSARIAEQLALVAAWPDTAIPLRK
ncbi:MAG: hypothetical protein LBU13_08965 [Synergistaceae bacterium]|jgi:hypothetical protein|nr:hypothetical protein [Synergistaceae bacterium]